MEKSSVYFGVKSRFYDKYARIQSEVADITAKFARDNSLSPHGLWLDLGSGTGFAKRSMLNNFGNINIISLDIALIAETDICADFDKLPFTKGAFDGIISCSAMQWSRDIEALLRGTHEVLKADGRFVFSVFEQGTLDNLQKTQIQFDIIPKVFFYDKIFFDDLLQKTGFRILANESVTFSQKFPDAYSALKSISGIGASDHGGDMLLPTQLRRFVSQYERSFGGGEIVHDYKTVLYIAGKK